MTALTPAGRELFLELVDMPEPLRSRALAERCKGDAQLAAEVSALLAADAQAEGFLEPPPFHEPQEEEHSGAWLVGRRIGQYTIVARIGMGGMGTVFMAEQDRPRRPVALKLLRTSYATPSLRRRFEREAEILGRLRHPGIAEIYEAGTHASELGPIPYFALEFIPDAKTITRWADDAKLDDRARVELLARVCDAVAEAHRHGIVHRDIKPSNILVGKDGAPKLIDFGIARWLDAPEAMSTLATPLGDLLGTLQYMSPEQFDATNAGPTTASDVYALGVVAYELLAGKLPYPVSNTNAARIAELVRTHVPEPLSRVRVRWRAVDAVVRVALAKAPEHRYPNAAELADDLRRAVAGDPVRARRSWRSHRVRTLLWRSRRALPWLAAGGAAAAAAYVIARDDAKPAPDSDGPSVAVTESADEYRHHIAAAERALDANDLARAKVELGQCEVGERGWEWHRLFAQVDRSVQVVPLGSPAHWLAHDPTRALLVAVTEDGAVHGLRAHTSTGVPRIDPAWRVTLDDQPGSLAIDVARGVAYVGASSGLVHRRRLDDGSDAGSLGARGIEVESLVLVGGELVVTRIDRTLERWDPDRATRLGKVTTTHQLGSLVTDGTSVFGEWVSWGVDAVDPQRGTVVRTFPATEDLEALLVDDDALYIAGWDDRITAFDRRSVASRPFAVEPDGILDLVRRDGDTLISAGRDGAIAIWDVPSGTAREHLRGHDFGVDALAIGDDGRWLASVSLDATLRTWDLRAPPIDRALAGAGDKIHAVAFERSGARVIAAIGGQWGRLEHAAVRSWSIADGREAAAATDHAVTVDALAIANDGTTMITASRDGIVHVRDATDLRSRVVIDTQRRGVPVLAFVDDGSAFVSAGEDGEVAWWGVDGHAIARAPAGVGHIADAAWTSAGLVVGGANGLARMSEGNATPLGELADVTAIAAMDGGTIVVGHGDGTLSRIELDTASARWSTPTFGRSVTDVAVSPDGTRIATSSQDYRVRLHDAASGEYLVTVGAHESVATTVAFSPDGKSIASGGYDRVVRLWHAPTYQP